MLLFNFCPKETVPLKIHLVGLKIVLDAFLASRLGRKVPLKTKFWCKILKGPRPPPQEGRHPPPRGTLPPTTTQVSLVVGTYLIFLVPFNCPKETRWTQNSLNRCVVKPIWWNAEVLLLMSFFILLLFLLFGESIWRGEGLLPCVGTPRTITQLSASYQNSHASFVCIKNRTE